MARRRPSELYQVDFVAALFGGFLLVWLSSVQEAEFASPSGESLAIFELDIQAHFSAEDGSGTSIQASVVPITSKQATCAHTALISKLAEAGRPVFACEGKSSQRLGSSTSGLWLSDQAKAEAVKIKSGRENILVNVFALDLVPLFKTPAGYVFGNGVGTFLNRSAGTFVMGQVGILQPDFLETQPPVVRVSDWARRSLFMVLADGKPLVSEVPKAVDFFRVDDASPVRFEKRDPPKRSYKAAIHHLTVELYVVKGGVSTCFSGDIAAGIGEQALKPC